MADGVLGRGQDFDELRELVRPDRILLREGRDLEGRLLRRVGAELELQTPGRRPRFELVPVEEVESVRAAAELLPAALERLEQLDAGSTDAVLAAAARLEQDNLPLEARLLYWSILERVPDDPRAHEALGHRRQGLRHVCPDGRSWYPLEQLLERRARWDRAWQLPTTHFDLRSNLPLGEALELAIALERGYAAFFGLFGEQLGLRELVRPIEVFAHADGESFEEARSAERSTGKRRPGQPRSLRLDVSGQVDLGLFMQELARALILESSQALGGSGPPTWLVEGLAQHIESVVTLTGDYVRIDLSEASPRLLVTHARAEEPLRLAELLAAGDNDPEEGRGGLRLAQAYTLVHYCLNGRGGELREPFLAFVASCLRAEGAAQVPVFPDSLGIGSAEAFERDWHGWARGATGGR